MVMTNVQSKLHYTLHYRLRQLGWQGIVGLVFIALSLLLLIFLVVPNTQKLDALNLSFAELKINEAHGKDVDKSNKQPDVITTFNSLIPNQSDANSKIAHILHAATNVGLATEKVNYAFQPYSPALIKVQIKFPTQGTYTQIRQFINDILNALPTIALTDIKLKREDIGSDMIEANIQFSLYVRENPSLVKTSTHANIGIH